MSRTSSVVPDVESPYLFADGGSRDWLVVCDHASAAIPPGFDDLGLADADRLGHIGWDIGALDVARRLAERLDAPLVASGWSRLLIDCNRYPNARDAIPASSDGHPIPGNEALGAAERAARFRRFFRPYHRRIAALLDAADARGNMPALLSIHSCSPVMGGIHRPWQIGLAWARDRRMAVPVLDRLRRDSGLTIGDNQPYDLELGGDFTTPEHAMARGLPHLQVEFRNDCVATPEGAKRHADILHDALAVMNETTGWRCKERYITPADPVMGAKLVLGPDEATVP